MGRKLLVLLSLLCCVHAAEACLQCDRKIQVLIEDFTLSAPTVGDQIKLKMIRDQAFVTYKETSQARKGVIDPTTMYRVKTEFQSELDRFLKTQQAGSATSEAIHIMEKGRRILEKHLDVFIRDGLCPNECGLLKRRVMDCSSCRYKIYICPSPSGQQDCGEQPVQAEEGGQAVLNCFLPWHRLLWGAPEYHYAWARGVLGTKKLNESDFKALVVTDDSSVVLNQLRPDEQGTYRCSLRGLDGTVFYRLTYPVAVARSPEQTRPLAVAPPSLPPPYGGPSAAGVVAVLTALCLAASVGLAVVLLRMMMSQRSRRGAARNLCDEELRTQSTTCIEMTRK